MRNDLSGADPDEPFTLVFATGAHLRQELVVSLDAGRTATSEPGADIGTTFVARNSSGTSPSNIDANDDGVSDSPVCTSHLERP